MYQQMLENKCRTFAEEIWGLKLNIPVEVNGRLETALGRFIHTSKDVPIKLEFSKRLQKHDEFTIDKIIKHELCHWALCLQGKPYEDYHPIFEAEIKRINSISTRIIKSKEEGYKAYCSKCGKMVVRVGRESSLTKYVQTQKVTTKCCHAIIVRNFGDAIQTAKDVLKDRKIYTIAGKPDRGKIILANRKIVVEQENDQVVVGYLLHQHSLQPQRSLITIEKRYLRR